MCGIFCAISPEHNVNCQNRLHSALRKLLRNRGPDVQDELIVDQDRVLLAGNVLWQQGSQKAQKQPVIAGQYGLLFNGDLYNIEKPSSMSDTTWLANKLASCDGDRDLISLLKDLKGPHCLVLYNTSTSTLYFSRDTLGRNSLLIERGQQGLNLMSTSFFLAERIEENTEPMRITLEVPPLGLYKLNINDLSQCRLYPWQPLNEYTGKLLSGFESSLQCKILVENPISPNWLLTNGSQKSDNYDFYSFSFKKDFNDLYHELLGSESIRKTLLTLDKLLSNSVAERVQNTAPVCRNCKSMKCNHAKVSVLFSGGIDCSILALLSDRFVPSDEPIELINVAFESSSTEGWNVPDRQTAVQSLLELQRLCPERDWRPLNVNVTRLELQHQLSSHIRHLIFPLQTVLDESLGCAFFFATLAKNSTSRVAILGSGADELFGGYVRHRNAYKRCTGDENDRQQAVKDELELDWQRIPSRNLARDDRVIADNSKTARAPFIEENVVQFVRSLEPKQRCCFSFPEGIGDKFLLRLYGYQLGFRSAVQLKKRAIQFGSRIANKKQQASQQSDFLRFSFE
ncbi:asparagine synthetase domain-containing protein CG17486 [Drosophila tropicalis]|uniref:asparagine synthetase domain-containing protein CG17486 n=1 Tax=Drosophila tropicalis TaxID=46794 RepID=UPI0035ABCA4C